MTQVIETQRVMVDGQSYAIDSEEIIEEQIYGGYILVSNCVLALCNDGNEYVTHVDNCNLLDGQYYLKTATGSYNELGNCTVICLDGIVRHRKNCRYIMSLRGFVEKVNCFLDNDGKFKLTSQQPTILQLDSNSSNYNSLYSYHSSLDHKDFSKIDAETNGNIFAIGFEIEKSAMPQFSFDREHLYTYTGCKIERDGSVSNGFELITPTYNLFSSITLDRLSLIENFINVVGVDGAGGHIGFSCEGMRDIELLNAISGFLPLIYGMYERRLTNHYCRGKKLADLINDGSKYQAIALHGNYIEFRLFSAVRSMADIKFRIAFLQFVAENLHKPFSWVIAQCCNTKSKLYKLLKANKYNTTELLNGLIVKAIRNNETFGTEVLTQATINTITQRIARLTTRNNNNTTTETTA